MREPTRDSRRSLPTESTAAPTKASEHRALGVLALLAALALLYIAAPVGVGLLIGTLAGFTLSGIYEHLRNRLPQKPDVAALVTTTGAVVALGGALALLGYLLVSRGLVLAPRVGTMLAPGGPAHLVLDSVSQKLLAWHVPAQELTTKLGDAASALTARAAGVASTLAGATFSLLLGMFFLVVTMHFTLGRWERTVEHLENLLPLAPRHTHRLMDEFRRIGRNVLLGTVVTSIAQGLLAGIGYKIAGVPEAAFLGALTAVAALLPVVGTMVIWIPVGIALLLTGHTGHGIVELVWGSLIVVGASDYVIRPALVGDAENMPTVATFIALFGGVEVFGLAGLIVGPVLVAMSLAVLRLREEENARRRSTSRVLAQLPAHIDSPGEKPDASSSLRPSTEPAR